MATVKVSSSKTCANAINYAKNKAVVMNGLNVDPKYAIGQMEQVRHVFDKTDGVQAHLFIQSFAPGEVTPQQANDIGIEFAQAISEDKHYQVAVYTHNDTKHIHNHLVLNAVDFETGLKYQQSFDVKRVRELSDQICEKYQLSVVKQKQAIRKPIEEIKAKEKGEVIWKDELRDKIWFILNNPQTIDFETLQKNASLHDLDVRFRGNGISYAFTDSKGKRRVSRGSKLGADYEKSAFEDIFKENKLVITPPEPPKISAYATQQIRELSERWQEWENAINNGITAEKVIHSKIKELYQERDNIQNSFKELIDTPVYKRYKHLMSQRKSELDKAAQGKELFKNTKTTKLFTKVEGLLDWGVHSVNNLNSEIPKQLEEIKPQIDRINLQIHQLKKQEHICFSKIDMLKKELDNNSNIKYRHHYRGHQSQIEDDIKQWKDPNFENKIKLKESQHVVPRKTRSRGMSR